jgi:hypothetical protein
MLFRTFGADTQPCGCLSTESMEAEFGFDACRMELLVQLSEGALLPTRRAGIPCTTPATRARQART